MGKRVLKRKKKNTQNGVKLEGNRKVIGWIEKPHYIVEDLRNPPKKQVLKYRRKKVDGHVITVAILKKKGEREGRTVVTSIYHPKSEFKKPGKNLWFKRDIKKKIRTRRK